MPEEKESGWRRSLAVPLMMIAGICLLVVVAPKTFPFSSGAAPGAPVIPDLPPIADVVLVVLSIMLFVSALFIRTVVTGVDRDKLQQRKPVWMQLIIFGLILFGVAAFSQAVRDRRGEEEIAPRPDASASTAAEGSQGDANSSRALGWVLTGLMVAMTIGVGGGTAWLIGKTRPPSAEEDVDALLRELDDGRERISEAADAGASVIACYLSMVEALQAAGVERKASDAPFEYLQRALERFQVSREHANRLTELFERARFSLQETDESMRLEALGALDAVRSDLAARSPIRGSVV